MNFGADFTNGLSPRLGFARVPSFNNTDRTAKPILPAWERTKPISAPQSRQPAQVASGINNDVPYAVIPRGAEALNCVSLARGFGFALPRLQLFGGTRVDNIGVGNYLWGQR